MPVSVVHSLKLPAEFQRVACRHLIPVDIPQNIRGGGLRANSGDPD